MIFSLYFQIIVSLCLSFLLHVFNFKKHFNSFINLLTLINTTNIATTENNNNNLKGLSRPISSNKTTISIPPRLKIGEMEQFVNCTKSIGFESIDEMRVDDSIYENDEYEGEYCRRKRMVTTVEGGVNSRNTFPPPLSTLDCNGQQSYMLLPVRRNGRLQLNKVNVKRPQSLHASRHDGRLRLYLVPDQCYIDDEEQDESDEEEEDEEDDDEVESESEEEMVEESRYEEDDRVREFNRRRCYHQQLMNHIHNYGSYSNLLMYGVGIA